MSLTVVKKSMTASKAGENSGSAPNSDSSTRSRSSWSPVINVMMIVRINVKMAFQNLISCNSCGNVLSLLLSGLVCNFLKTSGMDGMACRRSSISALPREPVK